MGSKKKIKCNKMKDGDGDGEGEWRKWMKERSTVKGLHHHSD